MYLNETVPHCKTNHSTFCTMTTFGKEVVQLQKVSRNCPLPCKTKSYKATILNYLSFRPNMQNSGSGIWFYIDKPYVKVEVSTYISNYVGYVRKLMSIGSHYSILEMLKLEF